MKLKKDADSPVNVEILCEGKSKAFGAHYRGEPHPAFKPNPPCMHCGADLGCQKCSGIKRELVCMECRDWGNEAGVAFHGRMLKTPQERADGSAFLKSALTKMVRTPDEIL